MILIMKKSENKKKIRNDIILAAVILLIAVAGLLLMNSSKTQGDFAVVKIDGVEKHRYSLSENVTVDIVTGKEDENVNTLVIKDGEAFMKEADCPDGICVAHRPIKNTGESIVCLPHKIVVEIQSKDNIDGLDAVA